MMKQKEKQIILTIHGIDTDGQWQETIKHVLEPHFNCQSITYRHYRCFGALKLLMEPWVLLPGLGLLWAGSYLGCIEKPLRWLAVLMGLAYVGSYIRRELAIKCVVKQVNQGELRRRNLIAHSLGTYLMARISRKHAWVRLKFVTFAGCVLPRKFEWRKLVKIPIKNET